jgi:hypothetical protein
MSHDEAGGQAITVVCRNTEEVVEHWGVADLYGVVGQLGSSGDGPG